MNRILEINEELAYAVVEPGVTWFDFYNAVAGAGYDLITPCPDLGWGSIIGNSMDAGHTYQHYGADYMLPPGSRSCCPTGTCCAPGAAGIPGSSAWHVYKRASGRRWSRCSCSRTSASSRGWASGSGAGPRRSPRMTL